MTSYRVNEIILATLSLLWSVWIVAFGTYETSNALAPLREWGVPGWVPLLWTFTFGLCLIIAPQPWRPYLHVAMCGFWIFIVFSLISVNPALMGVATYTVAACLHASKYHFAGRNQRA